MFFVRLSIYSVAFSSRPEASSDVISGIVVDPTGVDVGVKCDDSKSNRSQHIRLSHFVTHDERTTTPTYAHQHIRTKRHIGVLPKNDDNLKCQYSGVERSSRGQRSKCIGSRSS